MVKSAGCFWLRVEGNVADTAFTAKLNGREHVLCLLLQIIEIVSVEVSLGLLVIGRTAATRLADIECKVLDCVHVSSCSLATQQVIFWLCQHWPYAIDTAVVNAVVLSCGAVWGVTISQAQAIPAIETLCNKKCDCMLMSRIVLPSLDRPVVTCSSIAATSKMYKNRAIVEISLHANVVICKPAHVYTRTLYQPRPLLWSKSSVYIVSENFLISNIS